MRREERGEERRGEERRGEERRGEERWLIPLLAAQPLCCPAREEGAGCLSLSRAPSLFPSRPSSVTSSLLPPVFPLTSLAFSLPICPSLSLFLTSFPPPPLPPPPPSLSLSLSLPVSLCHWRASQCENAILLSRLLPLSGCGGKRRVCARARAFLSFLDGLLCELCVCVFVGACVRLQG